MASAPVPNLYDIPLSALRPVTIGNISALLNPPKILPTDDGLPRDWRGLAHLMNIPRHFLPHASHPNPTGELLKKWTSGTIGLLEEYIQMVDRWDVLEDTKHMMESDAILHLKNVDRASTSAANLDVNIDSLILTRDDVLRLEKGLPPQHYNAYLLYADADESFAVKIIDKMEIEYQLKLCVRDRDLLAGHVFEHEVIMRLISERCNRLIVVISESFLKSEAHKFFCTFAQALGIDQKHRKVIPVMHKKCRLPPELTFYFVLDYTRSGELWDFWKKLRDSIETPSTQSRFDYSSQITIRESERLPVLENQLVPENKSVPENKPVSENQPIWNALAECTKNAIMENNDIIVNGEYTQKKKEKIDKKERQKSNENLRMKKGSSISLENLKAKSKNWFGGFSQKAKKKNKKREAVVAL